MLAASPMVRLDGHDGSHHQFDAGPVSLPTLAQATWAIWWKATQSISYQDPTFATVWSQRALFTHRTAYHWLSSTTDPEQQAHHFIRVVDSQGGLGEGDGMMLDIEEAGVSVAYAAGFKNVVEPYYRRPLQNYSGLYVTGSTIWRSDELRQSKYGPYSPMHVAAYVTEVNLRARLNAIGGADYPWHAWQFSSNGPVPGITGRADMNRVDDLAIYNVACAISVQPPQPEPIPPTPTPPTPPSPLTGEDMSVLDTPVRAWDSRPGSPEGGNGKHNTGETFLVNITGKAPAPANARGVIVSLTVLDGEGAGFLTVWGAGGRPSTSNVNFAPGEVKNTLAVVPLSGAGINTFTSARCNVIVDVQGWVA
jgi:GH25 family lysozyme M1 (1,4-beta-N-acetylmuramidase)